MTALKESRVMPWRASLKGWRWKIVARIRNSEDLQAGQKDGETCSKSPVCKGFLLLFFMMWPFSCCLGSTHTVSTVRNTPVVQGEPQSRPESEGDYHMLRSSWGSRRHHSPLHIQSHRFLGELLYTLRPRFQPVLVLIFFSKHSQVSLRCSQGWKPIIITQQKM